MKRKILATLMAVIMLTSCNNTAQPQNTETPAVENTAASVSGNGRNRKMVKVQRVQMDSKVVRSHRVQQVLPQTMPIQIMQMEQ